MSEIVVALTTLPVDFDAAALARELVTARVAACVTVLPPVQSIYVWEGVVEIDREQQLLIKTTRAQAAALWTALKARHPYEVPEFVVLPVIDGSEDYLDWIRRTVAAPGPGPLSGPR